MAFDFHIVGAGRGGTSLIAALIDAHPRCEVHFEQLARVHLVDGALTPAARVAAFLVACETQSARFPGKLWGHKTTTEQIGALGEGLDDFLARTTTVPTIFILRDGRSCVQSKVERAGLTVDDAIERWLYSVDVLRQLRSTARSLHVLKYEDLTVAPERELARVCDFLRVSFDSAMLAGTRSEKLRADYRRPEVVPAAPIVEPPWAWQIDDALRACGYTETRNAIEN